jgi:tetratricopeptide (TPR) repeat protein
LDDSDRSVRIAAAWALRANVDLQSRAGRDLLAMFAFNADQPAGQLQQGAFYFSRHDPQRALAHLQKAVAWDATSAPLREEIAVVFSALGRPREAVAQLEEACRLAPRDAEARHRLALACNEAGDAKRAVAELQAAVRLDPQLVRAWYDLGLAQNALGETSAALDALARAEKLAPSDARIPYARATILARIAGRGGEAQAAAERALELQPDFAEAKDLLRALTRH